MLYLCKIKHAIPEDPKLYHNQELYQLALQKDYTIPTGHVLSPVKLELLKNDFKKNTISRLFYPDEKSLAMAAEVLQKILEVYIIGKSDTMTFEEAIDHMELSKSPGYPWNLKDQTKRGILEKFKDVCYDIVDRIEGGDMDIETFWQTSPKVEILTREKVEIKMKQRTFMCCDIIMYIVGLMLYGRQNEALLSMAYSHDWSGVGYSPFHGGTNWLANILMKNNPTGRVLAFDISAMEASITPRIFEVIYKIRNSYIFKKGNLKNWYFINLVYSLVIDPTGWLGLNIGVNPSGQLNTLMDNTLACILLLLYCLARQVRDVKELWILYCRIHGKVMGDDSIIQDTPETRLIPSFSQELGFTMTMEVPLGSTIHDVKFLNMGFFYVEQLGMFIFKPNFDKLLASILYYFKSKSWRLTLAKLYSIRILVYPYPKYLEQIDGYISYIWTKHDATLMGEENMDDKITYAQLKNLSLSPDQINFLIYGLESQKLPLFC